MYKVFENKIMMTSTCRHNTCLETFTAYLRHLCTFSFSLFYFRIIWIPTQVYCIRDIIFIIFGVITVFQRRWARFRLTRKFHWNIAWNRFPRSLTSCGIRVKLFKYFWGNLFSFYGCESDILGTGVLNSNFSLFKTFKKIGIMLYCNM